MAENTPLFIKILSVILNNDNGSNGMTQEEIANVLGVDKDSIKSDLDGMIESQENDALYKRATEIFKRDQLRPRLEHPDGDADRYFIPNEYVNALKEYDLKDYVLNAINE